MHAGERDSDKQRLLEQLHHLDGNYAGGLAGYIQNAKRLLEDSRTGEPAGHKAQLLLSPALFLQ